MRKDQPLVFWTAMCVLATIAMGLIGWTAAGISDFATVKGSQTALSDRVSIVEKKQEKIDALVTDIAVIRTKVESMESQLRKGE